MVCGAHDAPNAQLCHILSTIVTAIAMDMDDKIDTVSRSTEEMIATIEEVNSTESLEELVIYSTDVEAMYPSLDIDTVAKVAGEEFLESDLDIEIDTEELSLYLAVTHTSEELEKLGFSQVTHRRIHRKGQRPGITTEEILNRKTETVSKFHRPEREPNKEEVRSMFALALENLIKEAMGNHIYSFNGSLENQTAGAAIGTTLAGAIAVLYML